MSRNIIAATALSLVALTAPAHAQESAAAVKAPGVVGEIETGNGCAVEEPGLFEKRRAMAPETYSRLVIDDVTLTAYPSKFGDEQLDDMADGSPPLEYLTIERDGTCLHAIADAMVFIVWARPRILGNYAEPAPLAILSTFSGGAHCCTSLYALYPGKELKLQLLSLGNAEAELSQDWAGGAPHLNFGDDRFAYWNSSYAGSPGGGVQLDWSEEGYRLSDQMKGDAPDEKALGEMRDQMHQLLLEFGGPYTAIDASGDRPQTKGELDPIIWANLLDLIYSGHSDMAVKLFDEAWPTEVKGKRIFWRDFIKQMQETWIWEPWNLKDALDPDVTFAHGG
ncbi:hypothetical protein [Dongia rigui]|uniref:Uncharacterized protein n=1 Tax=Dongia rigui TaxID=940149 RepID=A0ABU5DXM6_9PROT|nr:hypothetical protein [Dongia rigui]MDY0872076.1 hypothetical protein [Dongia rigui]